MNAGIGTEIVFDPFQNFRTSRDLPDVPKAPVDAGTPVMEGDLFNMSLQEAVRELRVRMMNRALSSTRHNQKKADVILGLTYHQFRDLYRTQINNGLVDELAHPQPKGQHFFDHEYGQKINLMVREAAVVTLTSA